jgi:hypothetical protein
MHADYKMVGDNEYVAAVAGMPEHTVSGGTTRLIDGKLVTTYAVGDRIRWIDKGRTLAGVVVEVLTDDTYHVRRHVPDRGNEHHAVTAEQIVPF